jgi:nucleoside-diphosphate-sugar epimerase
MLEAVASRRMAVTGADTPVGSALVRKLLAEGCSVAALLSRRQQCVVLSEWGQHPRLHIVWGRSDNRMRLHSLLAIHEPALLFHLEPITGAPGQVLMQALHRYDQLLPVVVLYRRSAEPPLEAWSWRPAYYGIAEVDEIFGGDHSSSESPGSPGAPCGGEQAVSAESLEGQDISRATAARDYVYVEDVAEAVWLLAKALAHKPQCLHAVFRSGWRFTPTQWRQLEQSVRCGRALPQLAATGPATQPWGWRPQRALAEALQAAYSTPPAAANVDTQPDNPTSHRRAA